MVSKNDLLVSKKSAGDRFDLKILPRLTINPWRIWIVIGPVIALDLLRLNEGEGTQPTFD